MERKSLKSVLAKLQFLHDLPEPYLDLLFERDPALGFEFYKRFSCVMANRLESTFLQVIGINS